MESGCGLVADLLITMDHFTECGFERLGLALIADLSAPLVSRTPEGTRALLAGDHGSLGGELDVRVVRLGAADGLVLGAELGLVDGELLAEAAEVESAHGRGALKPVAHGRQVLGNVGLADRDHEALQSEEHDLALGEVRAKRLWKCLLLFAQGCLLQLLSQIMTGSPGSGQRGS